MQSGSRLFELSVAIKALRVGKDLSMTQSFSISFRICRFLIHHGTECCPGDQKQESAKSRRSDAVATEEFPGSVPEAGWRGTDHFMLEMPPNVLRESIHGGIAPVPVLFDCPESDPIQITG